MRNKFACIILAAGKGVRMKSSTPKVLHPICGRPMLQYVLDLSKSLKATDTVVVLGHQHELVEKSLPRGLKFVVQKRLVGTADAVKTALAKLKGFRGDILILYADIPLLQKSTLLKLIKYHADNNLDAAILTAQMAKPEGYGRISRDEYGAICNIVEEKDADDFDKAIKEINTGIICFNKKKLEFALAKIRPNNAKREYYLTDAIKILYDNGCLVDSLKIEDAQEASGVNSKLDLSKANSVIQRRINEGLMKAGVNIVDPATTFISYGVRIGRDTVIYPFTVIERDVKIGGHCSIGPFIHLREGTRVANGVILGNFLESVRSKISEGTLIKHFSYIGDTRIGKRANIGAGSVTANFDGKNKHATIIGDNAFVGSDSVLVAPVKIGKNSIVGAGSVLLKNRNVKNGQIVAGVPAKPLKNKR
ncbi:MAG: bifunctional N-acetylglucosamine-1-phosphate uridyltransferase/glucosamine-1-phosphate acetyltransferase [Candidatus Omnitrophota bacterium]|jgi:bifunctional UDP-N-acetylglucosamine pyrophosphorylase/glucosamine-1-phosphate N-acetyltransferase|nr:MAG: bifunctional N-acetylglucosamine-1-phosphate uridyltransferase/glucosamine-1-phosphate acetyltransferase [Candidatus Omnitrophota bacterium]